MIHLKLTNIKIIPSAPKSFKAKLLYQMSIYPSQSTVIKITKLSTIFTFDCLNYEITTINKMLLLASINLIWTNTLSILEADNQIIFIKNAWFILKFTWLFKFSYKKTEPESNIWLLKWEEDKSCKWSNTLWKVLRKRKK
jgi:hypothetical protein